MPGDGAMSCGELNVEMAKVRQEMILKETKIRERNKRNAELTSLFFLIYPLSERDTLNAEEREREALNTRYNNLFMIAVNKGCSLGNNTITVKRKGGRNVTLDDVLEDDLPSGIGLMATSRP
jgi:hypothetical protein